MSDAATIAQVREKDRIVGALVDAAFDAGHITTPQIEGTDTVHLCCLTCGYRLTTKLDPESVRLATGLLSENACQEAWNE